MENKILKISLFNEISLEYSKQTYNLANYLTKQLLNLLEILLLNYGRSVTTEELINILWENSDNPKSSLKFHVFKLRKMLNEIPSLSDIDFIVTTKGGYEFKPNVECIIDTMLVQENYNYIQGNDGLDEKTIHYAEIIEKSYKGMLKCDSEYLWFLQLEEYYHNIYTKTVQKQCEYYLTQNMNTEMRAVCLKGALIDPTIESNHVYYIQSLINLKEYAQAFEYYQRSTKMLIDDYALSLSDKMKQIYNFLMEGMEEKQNIEAITEYFKKKDYNQGAFYCEHTIFDYIYDMYLKGAPRTNCKYYLFIFEVIPKANVEKIILKTKKIIQESLRGGDVFTRISKYQFLALLSCEDDEIGHIIAQRVTKNIRKKVSDEKAKIFYFIDKVIDGSKEGD